MRHGLTLAGRYLVVRTRIPDRPGELIKLLALFADEHANVVSVEHHREGMDTPVTETEVEATLLTRDQEHCAAILDAMRQRGYAGRPAALMLSCPQLRPRERGRRALLLELRHARWTRLPSRHARSARS